MTEMPYQKRLLAIGCRLQDCPQAFSHGNTCNAATLACIEAEPLSARGILKMVLPNLD